MTSNCLSSVFLPYVAINELFVSQLIWYARACSMYKPILKSNLLTQKLVKQDYQQFRLKALFRKFYVRCNDLVSKYNLPLGRMVADVSYTYCQVIVNHRFVYGFSRFLNYDKKHTAGVTSQQRRTPPWHLILPPAPVLYFFLGTYDLEHRLLLQLLTLHRDHFKRKNKFLPKS